MHVKVRNGAQLLRLAGGGGWLCGGGRVERDQLYRVAYQVDIHLTQAC